jgi:transglutaminase-like putative cysteine protease
LARSLWNKDITGQKTLYIVDEYIRRYFIYTPEKIETLVSPEYMLSGLEINHRLTGDCDDISMFHAALLTCLGVSVRFVAIRSVQSDPDYDHVYIEALNNGNWVLYDETVPSGTPIEYFARIVMNV